MSRQEIKARTKPDTLRFASPGQGYVPRTGARVFREQEAPEVFIWEKGNSHESALPLQWIPVVVKAGSVQG